MEALIQERGLIGTQVNGGLRLLLNPSYGLNAVLRRRRLHAGDFRLVDRGSGPVVGCGLSGLAEEVLDPARREAQEDSARGLCGVAEVVRRAAWPEGEPAGPDRVHLVADPDFEGSVEHIPELVLAGVDVWRGPATGSGQALNHREAFTGARGGRLERQGIGDEPDPLAFACDGGKTLGDDCVSVVHGAIRVLYRNVLHGAHVSCEHGMR